MAAKLIDMQMGTDSSLSFDRRGRFGQSIRGLIVQPLLWMLQMEAGLFPLGRVIDIDL